jgi:hypothetical protein
MSMSVNENAPAIAEILIAAEPEAVQVCAPFPSHRPEVSASG